MAEGVPGSLRENVAGLLAFRRKHCWCQKEREFSLEKSPVRLDGNPEGTASQTDSLAFPKVSKLSCATVRPGGMRPLSQAVSLKDAHVLEDNLSS